MAVRGGLCGGCGGFTVEPHINIIGMRSICHVCGWEVPYEKAEYDATLARIKTARAAGRPISEVLP